MLKAHGQAMRRLEAALRKKTTYQLEEFVKGMCDWLDEDYDMALEPVQIDSPRLHSGQVQSNVYLDRMNKTFDTTLALLLSIELLQKEIFKCMVMKLVTFDRKSVEPNEDDLVAAAGTRNRNTRAGSRGECHGGQEYYQKLAKTTLNHLRWCDCVYHSRELLVDLLMSVPLLQTRSMQIEVITSMPALGSEQNETLLVKELMKLTAVHFELLPSVLETISNLCLPSTSPAHKLAYRAAAKRLDVVDMEYLPVLAGFLLENVDTDTAPDALPMLFEKLNGFVKSCRGLGSDLDQNNFRDATNAVTLIVNRLSTVFEARQVLQTAFLRVLNMPDEGNSKGKGRSKASRDHKEENNDNDDDDDNDEDDEDDDDDDRYSKQCKLLCVQMWVLFVLGGSGIESSVRVKALSVIASSVRSGNLQESHVKNAIKGHAVPLDSLVPSMLSLAQSCVACHR